MISKEKKVFLSIHGGSLSLCKCRRAKIKELAGWIWLAGCSLPMSAQDTCLPVCLSKSNEVFRVM